MQTYLELEEFCKLVHLNEDVVKGMMANGALNFKEEEGKITSKPIKVLLV